MIEANCLELPDQIEENAVRLICLLTIKALKYSHTFQPKKTRWFGRKARSSTISRWPSDRNNKYQNWRVSEYQRVGEGTVVRCSTILWLAQRVGEDGGEAGDVVGSLQSSTISWSGTRLSWKK